MSERSRGELSAGATVTAVVLGALVGVVGVMVWVSGTGLLEAGLVLLPLLAFGAVAYAVHARAARRGGPE